MCGMTVVSALPLNKDARDLFVPDLQGMVTQASETGIGSHFEKCHHVVEIFCMVRPRLICRRARRRKSSLKKLEAGLA